MVRVIVSLQGLETRIEEREVVDISEIPEVPLPQVEIAVPAPKKGRRTTIDDIDDDLVERLSGNQRTTTDANILQNVTHGMPKQQPHDNGQAKNKKMSPKVVDNPDEDDSDDGVEDGELESEPCEEPEESQDDNLNDQVLIEDDGADSDQELYDLDGRDRKSVV